MQSSYFSNIKDGGLKKIQSLVTEQPEETEYLDFKTKDRPEKMTDSDRKNLSMTRSTLSPEVHSFSRRMSHCHTPKINA
jgi:hypothetical protein